MARREEKKRQTRIDLMRAAVELFNLKGYEATTVDDIVTAAGYGRATFFRYFSSKDDVVFGDTVERVATIPESLRRGAAQGDPWTVVKNTFTGLIADLIILTNELGADCVRLWFSEPSLRRRYGEMTMQAEEHFGRFFADAWGLDYDTSVLCGELAAEVVGLSRTVVRVQAFGGGSLADALNEGFAVLEHGVFAQLKEQLVRTAG